MAQSLLLPLVSACLATLTQSPDALFSGRMFHTPITGSPAPGDVALADLDQDGHTDAVVTHANRLSVLRGDGVGNLELASSFDLPSGPFLPDARLEIADFNGDGWLDVVTSSTATQGGSLIVGDGAGGLLAPARIDFPGNAQFVESADLDGDGDRDLVFAIPPQSLAVVLSDGAGGFAPPQLTLVPNSSIQFVDLDLADATGDGAPDVFVVTFGNEVEMLVNSGNGVLAAPISIPTPDPVYSLVAGDFDLDGDVDLATGRAGAVVLMAGDGAGGFTPSRTVPLSAGYFTMRLRVARVGAAGIPGVLAQERPATSTSSDVQFTFVPLGPNAAAKPLSTVAGKSTKWEVAVGDLDEDGVNDVVRREDSGKVVVHLGDDVGGVRGVRGTDVQAKLTLVLLDDLTGDGVPDAVLAYGSNNSLQIHAGDPSGAFSLVNDQALPWVGFPSGGIVSAVSGDFDGDSIPDLALSSNVGPDLSAWLLRGLGGGTFAPAERFSFGQASLTESSALARVDLNGDGRDELAAIDRVHGLLSVAGWNATTGLVVLHTADLAPAVADPFSDTAVDLLPSRDSDGDGREELVYVRDGSVAPSSIWTLGTAASGSIEAPLEVLDLPGQDRLYTLGDVDVDGELDVVSGTFTGTPASASKLRLWSGLPGGGFGLFEELRTGALTIPYAPDDLDGDGKPELIANLRNKGNQLATWTPGVTGLQSSGEYSMGIGDLLLADMDGDGRRDAVFLHFERLYTHFNLSD